MKCYGTQTVLTFEAYGCPLSTPLTSAAIHWGQTQTFQVPSFEALTSLMQRLMGHQISITLASTRRLFDVLISMERRVSPLCSAEVQILATPPSMKQPDFVIRISQME